MRSTQHLGQLHDSTEDHHDREKRQAHRLNVAPEPAFSRPTAQQIGEPVVNKHTRVPDDEAHYSKYEKTHNSHNRISHDTLLTQSPDNPLDNLFVCNITELLTKLTTNQSSTDSPKKFTGSDSDGSGRREQCSNGGTCFSAQSTSRRCS